MFVLIFSFSMLNQACTEDDAEPVATCKPINISQAAFDDVTTDEFEIAKVVIEDDCLALTINYGGGCGTTSHALIAAEAVLYSMPPQRNLFLSLQDDDPCEMLRNETLYYDLHSIQLNELNEIHLHLAGWSEAIIYRY